MALSYNPYPRFDVRACVRPTLILILLVLTQVSCAPNLLQTWVEERGYTYYRDYSKLNILGYEALNGRLRPNSYITVTGREGDTSDLSQKKNRIFKIEGAAEIEEFLKTVTDGNITGKFELSATAEIVLEKPFKQEALAFIPNTSCDALEMSIVTNVLNTGRIRLKITDKNGTDITSTFKASHIDRLRANLWVEFGNEISVSGEGFYVGYLTELRRCIRVNQKEITLKYGEQVCDGEIGLCGLAAASREAGYWTEALVYISPSNFIGLEKALGDLAVNEAQFRNWVEILVHGGLIAAVDPWQRAIERMKERKGKPWRLESTEEFVLRFGDHLGMPGIPRVSGILIEVVMVDKEGVKLRVQHMKYEDVTGKKE